MSEQFLRSFIVKSSGNSLVVDVSIWWLEQNGFVEFGALYPEAVKMQQIHEKSLFKRENQKWVYVSGEHF